MEIFLLFKRHLAVRKRKKKMKCFQACVLGFPFSFTNKAFPPFSVIGKVNKPVFSFLNGYVVVALLPQPNSYVKA